MLTESELRPPSGPAAHALPGLRQELRSGREGHPTYRAIAQAMHERIAAVHPRIAAAMSHVDSSSEPRLERIMSEIRTHRRRAAIGG